MCFWRPAPHPTPPAGVTAPRSECPWPRSLNEQVFATLRQVATPREARQRKTEDLMKLLSVPYSPLEVSNDVRRESIRAMAGGFLVAAPSGSRARASFGDSRWRDASPRTHFIPLCAIRFGPRS